MAQVKTAQRAAEATRDTLTVLRQRAQQAGTALEDTLSQRGLAPQQLLETVPGPAAAARDEMLASGRKAGKRLAGSAERTRKELVRSAADTRREARHVAKEASRSGRKAAARIGAQTDKAAAKAQRSAKKAAWGPLRANWPWFLLAGTAVAAVVVYLRKRAADAEAEQLRAEVAQEGSVRSISEAQRRSGH